MKQKHILILTATFGMGHHAVSAAIKDDIIARYSGYTIEIVDLFDIINPGLKRALQKGYNVLTRDFEDLYNFFYAYKNESKNNVLDSLFYFSYQKKFDHFLSEFSPDIVISTFPMTSGFVSRYKQKENREIPLITVITDVVDSWEWLHENTNRYFVPSVEVKDRLRLKGVPHDRITVTGIPVRAAFKNNIKANTNQKKHILIMSSAMGKIKFDEHFLATLDEMVGVRFTLVTGTDETLYKTLSKQSYKNIEIKGFVDDIAKLMESADLIYTKPGGVTLFEAIHKELPLVLQDTNVGQETANVTFVKNRNIGLIVAEPQELIDIVERVIKDDLVLKEMKHNITTLKEEFHTDAFIKAVGTSW
jgi:UDP-N-acetylglucosamine:LPS N-acetylglucosamine transferase